MDDYSISMPNGTFTFSGDLCDFFANPDAYRVHQPTEKELQDIAELERMWNA